MAAHELFILRHAKSSWDDRGLDDHERPLAPRGRRAVKLLAAHVAGSGIAPNLVLCSSSRRTIETLEGIGVGGDQRVEDELYTASGGDVLERLRQVSEATRSVMVIGHNPALQILVLRLAGSGDGGPEDGSDLAELRRKFPTGALATLSFDCAWSELAHGCAQLAAYVRPKTLH